MTTKDIELLLLIHLKGPQKPQDIPTFFTSKLLNDQMICMYPPQGESWAFTLTPKGEDWVKEAIRLVKENLNC